VTIQITREGATAEQKGALIKGATDLLRDVPGKPPGLTFVVIREVDMEDWGLDGLCPRPRTGGGPRPAQPDSRSAHAWTISLRSCATNSAAGRERASGAPCPAHCAP
jgi:4-oxalocrotonate tautomerase